MSRWRLGAFIDQPILNSAFRYWCEQREGEGLPCRAAIDPLLIPRDVLPFVIWAEYLSPQGVMRYRLVGEEMVNRWGANFRGCTSSELFSGSYRQFMESAFATCYEKRRPVFTESLFRWDVGGWQVTQRLMLPFAAEPDDPPQHCLVIQVWPDETWSLAGPFLQRTLKDRNFQHTRLEVV